MDTAARPRSASFGAIHLASALIVAADVPELHAPVEPYPGEPRLRRPPFDPALRSTRRAVSRGHWRPHRAFFRERELYHAAMPDRRLGTPRREPGRGAHDRDDLTVDLYRPQPGATPIRRCEVSTTYASIGCCCKRDDAPLNQIRATFA